LLLQTETTRDVKTVRLLTLLV